MSARAGIGWRWAMRLSLFAVLFQAVLFGWHHHELRRSGALPVPVVENPSTAPQVADDADCCEICQVLHHPMAAAVASPAAPPTLPGTAIAGADRAPLVAAAPSLAFQARAPPRSLSLTVS